MKKVLIFCIICMHACVACAQQEVKPTEVQLNAEAFLPELRDRLTEVESELSDFMGAYPEVSLTEEEQDYVFARAEMLALSSVKLCAEECGMSEAAVSIYDLYIYMESLKVECLEVPLSTQKQELADKITAVCKYRWCVKALEEWSMNLSKNI